MWGYMENDTRNYRLENFRRVNNISKFSKSLIAGAESLYDTHMGVKNMLGKVKEELDNLYDFLCLKDLHSYPW